MSEGFCPFCGKPAVADARFCAACGRALPQVPAASDTVAPGARPAAPAEEDVYEIRPLAVRTFAECAICVFTLGLAWAFLSVARMGRRYRVTSQRIETRAGVFHVSRDYLDLFRVEDFEVVQPFFQRLRGAGDLKVWSMDQDEPTLTLVAIPDVQEVYETLRKLTREERERNRVRVVEGFERR